jgi:hypothetical protein
MGNTAAMYLGGWWQRPRRDASRFARSCPFLTPGSGSDTVPPASTTTSSLDQGFHSRQQLFGALRRFWALGEERIILASANELSPRSVSHFSDQGTSRLSLACRARERLGGLRSLANTSYRLRFPSFGRMLTNQTGVAGSDKRPRSKARHDSTDLPSRGSLPALRH